MTGAELRKHIILQALIDTEQSMRDYWDDSCMGDSFAEQYGADRETVMTLIGGLIREMSYGAPPQASRLPEIIERQVGRALDSLNAEFRRMAESMQTVTVTGLVHTWGEVPEDSVAPVALPLPMSQPKRRGRKPGNKICALHPDSDRFPSGGCRQCNREAQARHSAKRKAVGVRKKPAQPKPEPPAVAADDMIGDTELDTLATLATTAEQIWGKPTETQVGPVVELGPPPLTPLRTHDAAEESFIYSKPVRCPKCGAEQVRLRRLERADLTKDYWLHIRQGQQPCTIKIAHYQIKDAAAGWQPTEVA